MKYKLTLMYDGTAYHGWQRQHNGITIQEVLENEISAMFGVKTDVTGCSRTDARVHAKMYVCSFAGETTIPVDKIPFVLNTALPPDIRVINCETAPDGFNARFDTVKKTYEYRILNTVHADPFLRNYAWHYPIALDYDEMERACEIICGKKDFRCFMAAGSKVKTTVRNLSELSLRREGSVIVITAAADGFLYNMVRIIVGTLVYIGNGKLETEELTRLIADGDRRCLGLTAPPQGLSLVKVEY